MSLAKITLWGMYEHGVDIEDDLFKNWILPSDMDADLLKDNILLKGAEFEVVYANFPFMQNAIKIWSQKYYRTFERWLKALAIDYNPLENYDRMEEWQDGSNRNKSGNRNDIQNRINALTSSELAQHGETKTDASSSMEATGRTEGREGSETDQHLQTAKKTDAETSNANSVNTSNADTTHGSTMEHQTSAFNSSTYAPKDKDILTGDNTSNDANSATATVGGRTGSGEETQSGLENKNSTESGTSNDITSRSGSGSESLTGNEARSKTDAGNESLTSAGNDKESEQQSSIHTGRMHGNIGVTTSQQMLEAEWQVAKLNIYEEAADLFLTELCIYTY